MRRSLAHHAQVRAARGPAWAAAEPAPSGAGLPTRNDRSRCRSEPAPRIDNGFDRFSSANRPLRVRAPPLPTPVRELREPARGVQAICASPRGTLAAHGSDVRIILVVTLFGSLAACMVGEDEATEGTPGAS